MYKALNYWVFGGFAPNKTPYEFIDFARTQGLDGVELTVGDCLPVDISESECRRIAAYAKERGVGLRTLATGCYGTMNLGAADEDERRRAVDFTKTYLRIAAWIGAETILMDRCVNEEVFEKTVHLINDFKDYYRRHNQTIYENPSPGNKKGGISTLEDKALGCTQKSGSSKVVDVLAYAQPVEKAGLNLLSAPGNDLVASTALAVSGAQIVLFTTGRGTPFASAVPTVKVSSNTQLSEKKKGWIDFNAGKLLEDGMTLEELGLEFYEYVLAVANGQKVKSEDAGYRDLAIFKQGVTL